MKVIIIILMVIAVLFVFTLYMGAKSGSDWNRWRQSAEERFASSSPKVRQSDSNCLPRRFDVCCAGRSHVRIKHQESDTMRRYLD